MKKQKFGVEIELTGVTRSNAVKLMSELFGTNEWDYTGGTYSTYYAVDQKGRKWKAMSDSSINTRDERHNSTCDNEYACEIVTPICEYEDIELIQKVVRKLKANGATTNSSCGIHVHIDAKRHTAKTLLNLVNIMYSKEDMLFRALGVSDNRARRWCKKTDEGFKDRINSNKPTCIEQVERLWYDGESRRHSHYDKSRYHALNLHSLWQGKGIEFRCFNGTLHAGKIKAYIQLCLAISYQALTQNKASTKKTASSNERFTFRTWLLHLGLIGDEFETARKHLLNNLQGDSAYRYGRAA